MPHLNLQSGVPKVVASGVLVGATDFREFPVGVGLPAGITAFGSVTSRPDPLLVEIGNDGFPNEVSEEGHHFAMTGRGAENWGFGLDSFFGQMDRGEIRAVVRSDFRGGFEDFPIGAAAGMQGANNTDWRAWIGTQFLRGGVNDIESSGKTTFPGFGNTMFGIMDNDLQEPFIAGINVNVRIRRIANPGDPTNRDDWEIRSWYGASPASEPVLPDDDAINQLRFDPSLQAIGWGQLPQGPFNPVLQKIRFLSFSENPLVEPAPAPSDIAAVSPWVPSGNMVPVLTDWENSDPQIIPGGPKPLTILRPVVEFDVRQVRDDPQYNDGDSLVVSAGGVGWKDLEESDQQGRTDANFNTSGNILFVKDGWTPGIDAVRFVGFPVGAPTNPLGSRLPWIGGGIGGSDWVGNDYTIFGVMRATDISQLATLIGGTAGLSPIFPKKTAIWVQPDGSVVVHHTAEELVATLQPGSFYSLETAPGIVKPGDDLIFSLTSSANFGPRQGKTLRINGVEVGRNDQAFANFSQEFVAPTIGEGGPQAIGGPFSLGGLDRLIVYLAGFGSLATAAEVRAYESFLAGAFQFNFATQWVQSNG